MRFSAYTPSPAAAPATRTTTMSSARRILFTSGRRCFILFLGHRCVRPAVEIVLQDDSGGSGVQAGLPRSPVLVASRQATLGFDTRQALVLKDDRQRRATAQCLREGFNAWRHVVGGAIETTRQPDDQRSQTIFLSRQAGDLCGRPVESVHVEARRPDDTHRARQRPRRVADGNADSPLPHVQSSYATHSV